MRKKRYLNEYVKKDLMKKMVFLGGPRQVGKTTMAIMFLKPSTPKNIAYLNWDIISHKPKIMKGELPLKEKIIVFDEIHKYARWRNTLKGFYDEHYEHNSFLITGSARLSHFSKGGDSLLGRYHYYRLHPFTLMEVNSKPNKNDLKQLLTFGGFPEPFLSSCEINLRRWQKERRHLVIYEDLRDLENVKEVSLIDLMLENLPSRVGSPLSIRSIKEDLEVSHQSVERWICILENLYMVYRILPFGAPKIRAVKKEQKLYFWDWSQIEDMSIRFENMVASHLLKYCNFIEDTTGVNMELRFIRDTDKREIDFVVLKNKKPIFAVECKTGERNLSQAIKYFRERTNIPKFYQVHMGTKDYGDELQKGRVLPFEKFCYELNIP